MSKVSSCLAFLLLVLLLPLPSGQAQEGAEEPGHLALRVYVLRHQPAIGALALVRPHLSPWGSVELQPGGNTLVIRDTPESLASILGVVKEYDHAPRSVRLEIQMLEAYRAQTSPPVIPPELPRSLVERLGSLLRYNSFSLLAEAKVTTREGENVKYEMGERFQVSFRVGTLLADGRLKLEGFKISRTSKTSERPQLFHANLNLWLERPLTLVLARGEASANSLVVAVTCVQEESTK